MSTSASVPCIGQCAVSGQECIRNCIICYSDVGCAGSQGRGQFFRPTPLSVTLSLPASRHAFPQSLFPMPHLAKAWYLAPFDQPFTIHPFPSRSSPTIARAVRLLSDCMRVSKLPLPLTQGFARLFGQQTRKRIIQSVDRPITASAF